MAVSARKELVKTAGDEMRLEGWFDGVGYVSSHIGKLERQLLW